MPFVKRAQEITGQWPEGRCPVRFIETYPKFLSQTEIVAICQRTRKPNTKRKLAFRLCWGAAVFRDAVSKNTDVRDKVSKIAQAFTRWCNLFASAKVRILSIWVKKSHNSQNYFQNSCNVLILSTIEKRPKSALRFQNSQNSLRIQNC